MEPAEKCSVIMGLRHEGVDVFSNGRSTLIPMDPSWAAGSASWTPALTTRRRPHPGGPNSSSPRCNLQLRAFLAPKHCERNLCRPARFCAIGLSAAELVFKGASRGIRSSVWHYRDRNSSLSPMARNIGFFFFMSQARTFLFWPKDC